MEDLIQFTRDLVLFCVYMSTLLLVAYLLIVFIGAVIMSIPTWFKRIWRNDGREILYSKKFVYVYTC